MNYDEYISFSLMNCKRWVVDDEKGDAIIPVAEKKEKYEFQTIIARLQKEGK